MGKRGGKNVRMLQSHGEFFTDIPQARGGRGGGRGKGRGGGGGGGGGQRTERKSYDEVVKHNRNFEKYYNQLSINEGEEQELFWEYLRQELPNSFRFAGSKG